MDTMEGESPEAPWLDTQGVTQAELMSDPYPLYREWRQTRPPLWQMDDGQWMAQDYLTVRRVLTESTFGKGESGPTLPPEGYRHLPPLEPSMLETNPPVHTRLRSLVTHAFQPRHLQRLEPFITELTQTLLRPLLDDGSGDFVGTLAGPLPATVIAELLGVPGQDQAMFRQWSQAIVQGLDGTLPAEEQDASQRASWDLANYFHDLIQDKRKRFESDLLTDLIRSEEAGDHLTAGELLSMAELLLVAGHETTTNLLAMGLLTWIQHDFRDGTVDDWPMAVEEILRFTSPVQFDGRRTLTEVQLGEVTLPENTWITLAIGAANRDPKMFFDPDALRLDRTPNPHLAFARGIHFCLGAGLARLEAVQAFPLITRHQWKLEGVPLWNANLVLRGMKHLPVRVQ